jgi:C2 domain
MGNKSSAFVAGDGTSGNTDAAAALPGGSYRSLELSIACIDLKDSNVASKMDPFVVVWLMKGTQWVEVTRTQVIDNNTSPSFDAVLARFDINSVDRLKFIAYDAENITGLDLRRKKMIGSVEAILSDILKAEMWTADLTIPGSQGSKGTIRVTGEVMVPSSIDVSMRMRLDDVEQYELFSTVQPFIRISRAGALGGPPIKVLTTSVEKGKNVKFDELTVSFEHLANSDVNRSIKFELFDFEGSGRHVILAETSLTLAQLQQRVIDGRGALGIPLLNSRQPGKPCKTTLMFDFFQAKRVPLLWDYMKGRIIVRFFMISVSGISYQRLISFFLLHRRCRFSLRHRHRLHRV